MVRALNSKRLLCSCYDQVKQNGNKVITSENEEKNIITSYEIHEISSSQTGTQIIAIEEINHHHFHNKSHTHTQTQMGILIQPSCQQSSKN